MLVVFLKHDSDTVNSDFAIVKYPVFANNESVNKKPHQRGSESK